jgi:hypothetical protein
MCATDVLGVLQVFYKAVRDIQPREEMLLYARDAVYPEMELETMAMHKISDGQSPLYTFN